MTSITTTTIIIVIIIKMILVNNNNTDVDEDDDNNNNHTNWKRRLTGGLCISSQDFSQVVGNQQEANEANLDEERYYQNSSYLMILSPLDYCKCLLMGASNYVIQSIQKIRNSAVRLVLMAPRHHSTPLLQKLHWLTTSECIKYKAACMCFSSINGSAPTYLSELLHAHIPFYTLRSSSDSRMLKSPQQYKRKTHGFHSFFYVGPHIWNPLPQFLRYCSTLPSVKTKLKTFLFSQYLSLN